MPDYFNEDLRDFFAKDRPGVNPAIARAAMHYEDALKAVCADADHLVQTPRMLRTCCPPLKRLAANASAQLKRAVEEHVDHCYRARAGWGSEHSSEATRHRIAHETGKQQDIVDAVVTEACSDSKFAKDHRDVCCVATSTSLGMSPDSEAVAKACRIAEL